MKTQSERPYATGADYEDDLDRDEKGARQIKKANWLIVALLVLAVGVGLWIYSTMPAS